MSLPDTPEISFLIPARSATDFLEGTVRAVRERLLELSPAGFEIVLIPNPAPGDKTDHTTEVSERLASELPEVRSVLHQSPQGKGAALKTGFHASRGRIIFFTDADLPYDLSFLNEGLALLRQGVDLVSANRRLPESIFDIPVSLLPLAYGRHRLGLAFNQVARLCLGLGTSDTQAGFKGFSRALAQAAFSRQECPGFLFDLELFLTARAGGFRRAELPVTLRLNSEKSTVRLAREFFAASRWLARIGFRWLKGAYR